MQSITDVQRVWALPDISTYRYPSCPGSYNICYP